MKKSGQITLTLLAAIAMAACNRRYDPCDKRYFEAMACREAISHGGFYYHDVWYRTTYDRPYTYYYNSYQTYTSLGGHSSSHGYSSYSHSSSHSSSGVSRGGFGSTGSLGSGS